MNDGATIEATFCFVDIAGYTALTDTHGELAAANLVDDFANLIRSSVEPLGHLQSMVGDCAFFVFSDPIVAMNALSALYTSIADRQHFPVVRAGLHHGSALLRGNRHFGSAVNIVARVTVQATGGQILCTECVARALGRADVLDVEIKPQGQVSLRNPPDPMELYEVVLSGTSRQYAIDPVCKMQVDTQRAVGDLVYSNK
jgi:adenylate cyclase